MNLQRLRVWLGILCLVLAGCSAYPKKVDCEAHLRAINAPAPAASKAATP